MQKIDELERDILTAAYHHGRLNLEGGELTPGAQFLVDKYPSKPERQDIAVVLQYLLEMRYMWPYFSRETGKELRAAGYARGITPKGIERLQQLKNPVAYWGKKNWFPLTVAAVTALIGVGHIAVNIWATVANVGGQSP